MRENHAGTRSSLRFFRQFQAGILNAPQHGRGRIGTGQQRQSGAALGARTEAVSLPTRSQKRLGWRWRRFAEGQARGLPPGGGPSCLPVEATFQQSAAESLELERPGDRQTRGAALLLILRGIARRGG